MHPRCCWPVAWMWAPAYVVGVKDVARPIEQNPSHRLLRQVLASRLLTDNTLGALYLELQNTVYRS